MYRLGIGIVTTGLLIVLSICCSASFAEGLGWALIEGAEKRDLKLGPEVLQKRADINAKDMFGWTPLMKASLMSDIEEVKVLLDKGADVNAKSESGLTAVRIASLNNDLEMVRLLKAHGAKETGESKPLSHSDMLGMALLFLIGFAVILFSRINRKRMMDWGFLGLGLAAWFVLIYVFVGRLNDDEFGAIMGLICISGPIADVIAIPILRRRVIPPCVRVKRTPIYQIIGASSCIAVGISSVFLIFCSSRMMLWGGFLTATAIIYLILHLSERVEICANGVWHYGGLRLWEEYGSFFWKRKAKYGVELWLVPKPGRSWSYPADRLLVAPEDHDIVHQLLEANLPDRSPVSEA